MKEVVTVVVVICTVASGALIGRHSLPKFEERIVGGEDANIIDYPYQLSLQYYGQHICGASIISSRWAISAAHCVQGSNPIDISVRAGSSKEGEGGSEHQVQNIVVHPDYGYLDYDYGLIEVSPPFNVSEPGVKAIKLADVEPSGGELAVVSGWGDLSWGGSIPTILQKVEVPIVSRKTCKSAYGESSITERMICAGYTEGGKDACQGDSGGPLVVNEVVVGIVSWGNGCAFPGYPGVYSNVAVARDWISKVSGV